MSYHSDVVVQLLDDAVYGQLDGVEVLLRYLRHFRKAANGRLDFPIGGGEDEGAEAVLSVDG